MNESGARRIGEPFIAYRERRIAEQRIRALYLRGRVVYAPCQLVTIPLAGVDEQVDELVRRGVYRDPQISARLTDEGKPYRIARTKGVPYVKPVISYDEATT